MKELNAVRGETIRIILGSTANVALTIGLVILNKYIVTVDGFDYIVFLSCLHFVFTCLGCIALSHLGFFVSKVMPLKAKLSVAFVSIREQLVQAASFTLLYCLPHPYLSPCRTRAHTTKNKSLRLLPWCS